jgi:hypothetical protein
MLMLVALILLLDLLNKMSLVFVEVRCAYCETESLSYGC